MHIGKIMFVAICSRYPFYIGYFDKTNGTGKRYLVCHSSSSGARDMKRLIFKMADGGHLAFSHKKGTKTQK